MTEISGITQLRQPDQPFTADLRPVRDVVATVRASLPVDGAVFESFAEQAGPGTAALGQSVPREKTSGTFSVAGTGAMVVFESVEQVEASFTYRCAGAVSSGVVSSWAKARSGIMQCDAREPATAEVVREVTALAC